MNLAFIASVTTGGLALMQAWIAGSGVLSITGAKGGEEAVDAEALYAQTGISGSSHALGITLCEKIATSSGSLLRVNVQVPMETSPYLLRQIGLYAKLVDGNGNLVIGETLLALYQVDAAGGMRVPSSYNPNGFAFEMSMALRIGNDDSLSLQVEPQAYVSGEDLEDALYELHPKQLRTVETLYIDSANDRYGIGEWKAPGTTWTAGRSILGVAGMTRTFTAPVGMYACAIRAEGVTENSMIMDAWLEFDEASGESALSSGGSPGSGDVEGEVEIIDDPIDGGGEAETDIANGEVPAPIEYETIEDGWILLTSSARPTGIIRVGLLILL